MKNVDLDAECDFRALPPEEVETACKYEYMRESQTLTDALNARTEDERRKRSLKLLSPFFLSFTEAQFVRLMLALQKAGFPKPWKRLSKASQTQLVSLLAESRSGDKALYPPVVFEDASVEFDHYGKTADGYYHWRLEPSEPSLLKGWERSGRTYFWGFIRIDRGYNKTEAVEAFKDEFAKRWGKTKGGNRERWRAKLRDLAVMRLCKRFPGKQYPIPNKRVKYVAGLTGLKGCNDYWEKRRRAVREKREVEQQISKTAEAEMSSARSEARTFFQSLFPDEEPISWPRFREGKS